MAPCRREGQLWRVTDALPQRPRILPPVILLGAAATMWLLDRYVPIVEAHLPVVTWAGIVLIALGTALALWSAWEFRRASTPIVPFLEPTALVTSGPYRTSRNPIYMGFSVALIGVAAVLRSASPFVVVPLFVWIIQRRFVESEEGLLEHRFGEVYRAYKAKVRRWI